MSRRPEILAPAGDMKSFLAALAAGADAVYMGLKHFSARMQADNFSTAEVARALELAEAEGRRVYIAFNTMMKPNDVSAAGRLIARLAQEAPVHALIVQDIGTLQLARQAGFTGSLYLSTLANITHPAALQSAMDLGAERVIVPRELSIDEIRQVDAACPDGLDFEMFIHGALCWAVSGRCYWSSYMGGKSSLRGRCVQPCRRMYRQEKHVGRGFSCLDLSLDVLVRSTADMPHLASWKIEGRKKGPHYVYHVVSAYKILRDEGEDSKARKEAVRILEMSLGRPTTRAHFLPQRDSAPTKADTQTASGLLVGKVHTDAQTGKPSFRPHIELLHGDYLRVGYEDEKWHANVPVTRRTPKAGTFFLRLERHKTPKAGTPVFLIDRREPEMQRLLQTWQQRLDQCSVRKSKDVAAFVPTLPQARHKKGRRPDMIVRASVPQGTDNRRTRSSVHGLWLTPRVVREISRTLAPTIAWWLPPVIWPNEENMWQRIVTEALRNGGKHFVCNAPWQVGLFSHWRQREQLDLIAGPFCNLSNAFALAAVEQMGFSAAFVSPELNREDFLQLPTQSPIPLGAVLSGFWPVAVGRHQPTQIRDNSAFQSPKGEQFWTHTYGQNTWLYPAWPMDLSEKRHELEQAGYAFFATLEEHTPKNLPTSNRPGLFNWEGTLL